jgi:hypothetical protein
MGFTAVVKLAQVALTRFLHTDETGVKKLHAHELPSWRNGDDPPKTNGK